MIKSQKADKHYQINQINLKQPSQFLNTSNSKLRNPNSLNYVKDRTLKR